MTEPRMTVAKLNEQVVEMREQAVIDREQAVIDRANFEETITQLELQLEDVGWTKLAGTSEREFTRAGLRAICLQSFLFYMKNPLIGRAGQVQASYVFGQGITVKAEHPLVDEVVQAFIDDKQNQRELTSVPSLVKAEIDLRIDANLFFVFFEGDAGATRIAGVVFDEIEDIKANPENRKEPWYYLRQWTQDGKARSEWYPDIDYRPSAKPATIDGKKVNWDTPMYHVKVNAVLDQKFGTSEFYSAQDWAGAYNKFLSNWSTIVSSLARFAWNMVKKSGSSGRLAAKAKLDSKISENQYQPAPAVGSVFISDEDTKMSPIKTSGATTSAEDGRRLLLMVCAATGLPETFYGDVSVGTLATARSLNRPTELAFSLRQRLWEMVIEFIVGVAIRIAAEHSYESDDPDIKGTLSGEWDTDENWGESTFVYADDTDNDDPKKQSKPIDVTVGVDFPPLVEDDQKEQIEAIVAAATLGGDPLAGTMTAQYAAERLLRVLGETSIEETLDEMFPEGEEPEAASVAAAVQDLQVAIEALSEARGMGREETLESLAAQIVEALRERDTSKEDE